MPNWSVPWGYPFSTRNAQLQPEETQPHRRSEWGQQQLSTAISRMVRQPAATWPKRLPDNSTIFAAEATAITLALNYYQHMGPVHHDVIVYSDSMSCLQAIEGEDTENPFICHIMNLLLLLNDKGTHICFCWIPSHCGIDGNERVDQLAKETLDHDRSSGGCPQCRFETTGQLLHPAAGSNQVGCSCTWQRSLFRKTNTGATEEIPALNQSWRGCNHLTSNQPNKGHLVPYLVPRTADCLSPLWSNTDHWPYAPGVCSVTGMSWWIPHSWLIEYPLQDNSRDLHSGIPAILSDMILLSDMTQLTSTSSQTWTI